MGEFTYSDAKVAEYLNSEVAAVKLDPDGPLSERFFVRWTPVIMGLDAQGDEHHRQVGFLPPEQYLPALMLMKAKARFAHRRWKEALEVFEQILKHHGGSFAAPEAVYLGAVSRYRLEKDASVLKAGQERMARDYGQSEWAARMQPYRLL